MSKLCVPDLCPACGNPFVCSACFNPQLTAERNDLQAEVERLRANSDGWEHLSDQNNELWCAAEKRNEALRTLIEELVDALESGDFEGAFWWSEVGYPLIARARVVLGGGE